MNKSFLLCLIILVVCSCGNEQSKEYNAAELKRISEIRDSLMTKIEAEVNEDVFLDTIGLYEAPVKVLSSKIIESGRYRNIQLSFKNVSSKKIDAIKFRWKGEDAFGDLADMGNPYAKGFGNGFDDSGLNINQTKTGEWSILSKNARKVILAWATEVVFSDGTKWELSK